MRGTWPKHPCSARLAPRSILVGVERTLRKELVCCFCVGGVGGSDDYGGFDHNGERKDDAEDYCDVDNDICNSDVGGKEGDA